MAKRKYLSGIFVLILAILACSGGKEVPNVQQTVDAAVHATQTRLDADVSTEIPTLPFSTSLPLSTISATDVPSNPVINPQSPCEASKWEIHAISKLEQPTGNGLKLVFVQLVIKNGSSRGGTLS